METRAFLSSSSGAAPFVGAPSVPFSLQPLESGLASTHWEPRRIRRGQLSISRGVLGSLAVLGRKRQVKSLRSQSRVCRAAQSFTSESNAEGAQTAINEALSAVQPKSGFALLLIPRRLLSDASSIVQRAVQSLAGVQVVACVTGGPTLQLCALESPTGQVQAFSADPNTMDNDLQAVSSSASCVLLFGDPTVSPPALGRMLDAVGKKWPSGTVAGMMVAPGSGASVWVNGKPVRGGFVGLALPFRATAALDLVGCKAVGEELEIFEAFVQRGKAPEIIQIGTDQEGDYRDVAETEKGTAGIPRRVGIPAAAALKSVMQKHGISGPKEMLVGLSRPSTAPGSRPGLPSCWSLFNWVGVSKSGAATLAGGDPITEGLMPKGALQSCQCFQVSPASEGWQGLASQGASLTLALAGGRNLSPREAAATVAPGGRAVGALGVSVLGKAGPQAQLAVHRQAGLVLSLFG